MARQQAMRVMGNRPRPYVMAHRGNSVKCPENTMAAFRQAIADGTDAIETDLHVSSDGEFMCIHDGTLERTTNGHGSVKDKSREELQGLSASYGRSEFATERIPTLRELLEVLPATTAVALELKCDDFLEEAVCQRLWKLLQEMHAEDRAVVLSFSKERMRAVRRFVPGLSVGMITMFDLMPGEIGELTGPWWPFMLLNPFYVMLAHRRGQLACPLDPTPEPRLWLYKLFGCDAVLTNDPALTLSALGRK